MVEVRRQSLARPIRVHVGGPAPRTCPTRGLQAVGVVDQDGGVMVAVHGPVRRTGGSPWTGVVVDVAGLQGPQWVRDVVDAHVAAYGGPGELTWPPSGTG